MASENASKEKKNLKKENKSDRKVKVSGKTEDLRHQNIHKNQDDDLRRKTGIPPKREGRIFRRKNEDKVTTFSPHAQGATHQTTGGNGRLHGEPRSNPIIPVRGRAGRPQGQERASRK